MFRDADIGMALVSLEGQWLSLNDSLANLLGYTQTELMDTRFSEIIHSDDRAIEKTERQRLIDGEIDKYCFEIRCLHQRGHEVWVWINVSRVKGHQGTPPYCIVQVHDISKRKRTEIELRRLNTHLEHLVEERTSQLLDANEASEIENQAKSQFIANMSHEFRTPLNGIMGFSQLLLQDPRITPDQQSKLNAIYRSGEHLLSMVNEVITLSKSESGQLSYEPKDVNLRHLCESLQDLLSLQAASKDIQFHINLAADVPQYVRTDANKLRRILINLLGNALKFTKRGSVECEVQWRPPNVQTSFPQLRFTIQDTGPGIPDQLLTKLFDPFVQDPLTRDKLGGLGLGLCICQRLVHLMRGDISIQSVEGQGTTVDFSIQVDLSEVSQDPKASQLNIVGLEASQASYRILVVEDHPNSCQTLVMLLETIGFEVKAVVNGQEAMDINRVWQPHLIWMDLHLPMLNGLEAAKRIKAQSHNPPVIIAITDQALESNEVQALNVGCDDYLRKPYEAAQIFHKMAQFLDITYRYNTSHLSGSSIDSIPLTADELAKMPAAWVQLLSDAAIMLDADILDLLLRDIPEDQQSLKASLEHLMTTYQYDLIVKVAQTVLRNQMNQGG